MHSLREGFNIVMYSGTYRVNLEHHSLHMHKSNEVRLHLPPWMCIVWHEALYHSGAKSRDTPHYQADMRFFAYLWPYVRNQVRNRAAGTMDGVAQETGEQIYRDGITYHTCGDIYEEHPTCVHCKRRETVVDLRGIPPTSYSPGERIIGDLEELGWIVVRGVRIDDDTYESINNVSQSGRREDGTWFPVQSDGQARKMKYKHTASPHTRWSADVHLRTFTEQLTTSVINKINPNEQYQIGKLNLLKNTNHIYHDQMPHKDYLPRKNT